MHQMINERELPSDSKLRDEIVKLSQTVISAKSFDSVSELINIPQLVSGLTILDVGSGGSDFTATLLEKDADAYAIDPAYVNTWDLKKKLRKYINDEKRKKHTWAISQEIASKRFLESIRVNPDHYRADQATKISFPDNFFDLIVSVNCLVPYLDLDRETFFNAVGECLRVTKPGGIIQIFPFQDEYPIFRDTRMKNQWALMTKLDSSKISYAIERVDTISCRLTLNKDI